MRRLKLDYASLHELNPKLIYCSISGYGQTGPSAELPAYAPVIHAASGYEMAHLAYQPGRSRPDYCGIYHADVLTGVYAFGAISAALYQRNGDRAGPAHRRLDAGIDAEPDAERTAVVAIRGEADAAADVRPDRDDGRLCDDGDRQREDFPEPDAGDRSPRVGERSALCEIFRSPGKLGEPDGRRRGVVAHCDDRAVPRGAQRRTAFRRRPIAPSPRRCAIRRLPIAAHWPRSRTAAAPSRCSTCRSACRAPKCRRRSACRRSASTRAPI